MSEHPPPQQIMNVSSPLPPPASGVGLVAVPASVIVYEGLRMAPSLVCLGIVGLLIRGHSIPAEMGLMALLAILAGQLYPKQQGGKT